MGSSIDNGPVRAVLPFLVTVLALLALAVPAHAAFPGANGKIAFVRDGDIWTMDSDGSNQADVTLTPLAPEESPAWSADGRQIAYARETGKGALGSPLKAIWVMNANGSGQREVVPAPSDPNVCGSLAFMKANYLGAPAWSADGSKLVFHNYRLCQDPDFEFYDYYLYTVNPDGTGLTLLTRTGREPRWSPDGAKIGYTNVCGGGGCFNIWWIAPDGSSDHGVYDSGVGEDYFSDWSPDASLMSGCGQGPGTPGGGCYTIHPDGSGKTALPSNVAPGAWSPDGKKFVWGGPDIYTGNMDGTGVRKLAPGTEPDWQPIPLSYARPKGASPFRAFFVPAYKPCTASNRTHGAPLAYDSCNPPQQASDYLTLGTADANGNATQGIATMILATRPGDLKVAIGMQDIRRKSDLSDYAGQVEVVTDLRITDRNNTPNPGGPGPATVQDTPLRVPVSCTATASTTIGSDCNLQTTLDALYPGALAVGQLAIWQLGQVKVFDGGASGVAGSSDATLFMDQGLFIP